MQKMLKSHFGKLLCPAKSAGEVLLRAKLCLGTRHLVLGE